MDRLAYQNMTSRGRNPSPNINDNSSRDFPSVPPLVDFSNNQFTTVPSSNSQQLNQNTYFEHNNNHGGASLNSFSQPTGELTNKSKSNTQINNYHLERQSKNSPNYNNFVYALNNNITEDQQRTTFNNDKLLNEREEIDNFQRVYHPGLTFYHKETSIDTTDFERNTLGACTRDRRENGLAKNNNTPHPEFRNEHNIGLPQPPPKLNYPHGYDQLQPMTMDMTSHLSMQFQTLTNPDMDQQITTLQQKSQKNEQQSEPHNPLDRRTPFQQNTQNVYNPQVDHLNQQMQEMSKQMPDNKNSIALQFQNMGAMHNLSSIPNMPSVDPLNFQRPSSSNNKPIYIQSSPNIPNNQPINYQQQQQPIFSSW